MNLREHICSLGLVFLCCCSSEPTTITYQFHIGQHWATPYILKPVSNVVRFDFMISSSTYYDRLPEGEEGDWNKLGYIYEGVHPHLGNSVTFVWKWEDYDGNGRKLHLGWYGWQKISGQMYSPQEKLGQKGEIGVICPDHWYHVTIFLGDVVIDINGNQLHTGLRCDGKVMLPPYFGGQAESPGEGRIMIRYY